jgi:CheY-like chemotaxis protein
MEAIGRLAGGVAHDFNNILTVIGGYSAILREDLPVGSPTRDGVESIIKAAGRASTLTRQLLAFSRKQVMEPWVIAPADLLRNVEAMLGRVIGEDVELTIFVHPDAGAVKADPGQLEQVLMNLAVNARDAMPGGGRLAIETANCSLGSDFVSAHPMVKPGEYVQITVTDTGCGMDKETLARIFEPFFTTKPPGKGTGLGLSMAYGIVKQSGGHIFCESRVGKGSTFALYFPRVFEQPVSLGGPVRGSEPQRGNGTILLVEDEPGVRGFVQSVLVRSGYEVLAAADGQEALKIVSQREHPVDLLLTDVVMPRMGGTELAGKLREVWPSVRILYMSGYAEAVIVRDGVLDPTVKFLRKPFSPRELLEKIREMMSGPAR